MVEMITSHPLAVVAILAVAVCSVSAVEARRPSGGSVYHRLAGSDRVTKCGGFVNSSHGFIQTPRFPRQFPVPISCRWVIHSPPGYKIVLYFTQYYMRESFKLTEYDYYETERNYRGRNDLGEVSFEDELTSITIYKPYLVLQFQVEDIGNIHLRVDDFLLDVYGFNITYEIVDEQRGFRPDACSVFKCSFLGNCFATADFETYKCHCFSSYFGDECQYGPYCNPDNAVNMCKNGGKCRYFYGSLVNTCECPPGFEGVQCEKKREGFVNSACEMMRCDQRCTATENGNYECICDEGFRLMPDNRTCAEKRRVRYHVEMRAAASLGTQGERLQPCANFNKEIILQVQTLMNSRLQEFENLTILNLSYDEGYWYIEYFFMGEKSDEQNVWSLSESLIEDTTICELHLDPSYLGIDAQPALQSMSLTNYDEEKPTYEGKLLTLSCKARGSEGMQFYWYKDGAPIHVHKTQRNMWQMKIPPSDGETRVSVLNIDHADILDEGVFTCKVTDWNESKEKSIHVTVLERPLVEVMPLAASVAVGDSQTCMCLSRDDKQRNFQYTWTTAKDSGDASGGGREITKPGVNSEVSEDLFPTGRIVRVQEASVSQMYTCVVVSPWGRHEEHCNITVVPVDARYCSRETAFGVNWDKTAENATDIQRCPQNEKGKATRLCTCADVSANCTWLPPDMSDCVSLDMEATRIELLRLQLGYMTSDTATIFRLLEEALEKQDLSQPILGDLHLALDILVDLQDYARRFHVGEGDSVSLQGIIRLASLILQRTLDTNAPFVQSDGIGLRIMALLNNIRRDGRNTLPPEPNRLQVNSQLIDINLSRHPVEHQGGKPVPVFSSDDVALSLVASDSYVNPPRRQRSAPVEEEDTVQLMVATYRRLSEVVSNASLEEMSMDVNSEMVFVGQLGDIQEREYESTEGAPITSITFQHSLDKPDADQNASVCLKWSSGDVWDTGHCMMLSTSRRHTTCVCKTPGHFAVAMKKDGFVTGNMEEVQTISIAMLGCIFCIVATLATLIIRVCLGSEIRKFSSIVVMNVCTALICLCGVFIFDQTSDQMGCRVVILFVVLFTLVTLTFLLLEALQLLFISLSSVVQLTPLKLVICGWGFPVVVFVLFIIIDEVVGTRPDRAISCWVPYGHWELYAFSTILVTMMLVYAVLMTCTIRGILCPCKAQDKSCVKSSSWPVGRSVMLTSTLLLTCIFSVIMGNETSSVYECLFAAFITSLGLLLLIFRGVLHLKRYAIPVKDYRAAITAAATAESDHYKKEQQAYPSSSQSSSGAFKAYIRPQCNGDRSEESASTAVQAEENASTVTNANYIERPKSFRERREHLSALLGTAKTPEIAIIPSGYVGPRSTVSSQSSASKAYRGSKGGKVLNKGAKKSLSRPGTGEDQVGVSSASASISSETRLVKPSRGQAYIVVDPTDEPLLQHVPDARSKVKDDHDSEWHSAVSHFIPTRSRNRQSNTRHSAISHTIPATKGSTSPSEEQTTESNTPASQAEHSKQETPMMVESSSFSIQVADGSKQEVVADNHTKDNSQVSMWDKVRKFLFR